MTKEEFLQLIEEQGAAAENWPHHLRPEIDHLLANDSDAVHALAEYRELDTLLLRIPVPDFSAATRRIANIDLPAQSLDLLDTIFNWLFPYSGSAQVWRPALLACLPLLFGVAMGNYFNFGISNDDLQTAWDDELLMLSLSDYPQDPIEL
jgi:hypothetical protein